MAAAENEGGGGARYAACLQCTQQCHQSHGQGLPISHIPSFYSLLPSSSLSLPIPPAFLGGRGIRIDLESAPDEPLHSEVQLEGPSGEIWNVSMQGRTLGNLAFTKGWREFVTDHGLSVGDLLLFKLLSRGFFSVTIYGNDGCEKADAFTVQNSGTRLMANAHGSKKRPVAEKVLDCKSMDVESKRRKVECDKQSAPLIIDIDDDKDQEDDLIILSKVESGNANQSTRLNGDDLIILSEVESGNANQSTRLNGDDVSSFEPSSNNPSAQIEQAGISESTCQPDAAQHISPSYMPAVEQVTCCSMDTKEDTLSHLNLVELPPTPTNADKSNLPIIMQTELHLQVNSSNAKCNPLKEDSTEFNEQEASSSDDSDNEDCYDHVKQVKKSLQERMRAKDSLDSLDESLQDDRLKAFLAKDYMTEAFISKRRPVSDEERQKALLAAKRFKSNRPHLRKLMKESHVYRGFWLSLPADFSSAHLPSEIQQATLLDASGKAWSARWLGSRSGLSGGWRKFSLDHGLEEGDICVFELVDRNKLVIKVHIFRVVELRNEVPGRDHYLRKPQSRPLIGYSSKKSASPSTGYTPRKSSGPEKKMRGAIASKNTSCVHSSPTSREAIMERLMKARQLDPLSNKSENRALQSASKLASTSKEVTYDSKAKVSKNTHNVAEHSSPTSREAIMERLKARQLDPLSNKSENRSLQSASKLASTSKEVTYDSKAKASKNTRNVAEDTSCLHTPPTSREAVMENLRLKHYGRGVARQLDPLFNKSENRLPESASKLASTAKEVTYDSKTTASKKYYTVERLFNRRKGIVEEEFLVELENEETLTPSSSRVKREGTAWWVPLSHFTKDKMSCHL